MRHGGAIPDVSMIVCTCERPSALVHCLASIRAAAASAPQIGVELILVDNSESASAAPLLGALEDLANLVPRLVHEPVQGLARARNAALRAAQADIMAFTDDDCRLAPDYFGGLLRAFAEAGDGPVVMGGLVTLGDERDFRYTVRAGEHVERFHSGLVPGGFLLGCNLALDRAAFQKIGLFDTRFGAGGLFQSAEDTDYVVRAYEAGVPVIYAPHFSVSHHHGRATRDAIDAVHAAYNFGNGALFAKHLRSSPWMRRQFGWLVKACVHEVFTGRRFDPELGLSHLPVLTTTLSGMRRYWALRNREPTP